MKKRKFKKEEKENICNKIKRKFIIKRKRICQNVLHAAEAAQCN